MVQRRRWEGGFLSTALRWGFREASGGLAKGKIRTILAGLDLMVPPLALFAILNFVALVIGAILTFILVAWMREGRDFISLGVLARLPLYVLWKLPMYLGFARRGAPKEWLRTGR